METSASIWDTDDLSVFAGNHPNMRSFVNTVLQSRAFRCGVPPDAAPDTDRRAWLEAFWERTGADGTRGFRRIAGVPLPPHIAAVAEAIGATMVQPPQDAKGAITLRTADNYVLLDTRVTERHLLITFIIAGGRCGLGRRVCGLLADWAADHGIECVAFPVVTPKFFARIGWRNLGGSAWGAPERTAEGPLSLAA